jgi:DNA helicase-2/ATP-dependent DNA helicase PcrA
MLAAAMRFVADLHIHSHLSRATSKDLDLPHLHRFAQLKGIGVLGTGDFTHPRWLAELREQLVPAEPGLFALRPDLARAVDETVPPACRRPVRFMLQVEISNIYKRGDKVRKVHNLAFAPDFDTAARIAARLAALGNIESDGRPILGVDSRDLLEIVLESSPDAFLVPAHVWTPWFSALGAQSGFDAITECFADLSEHIFAVETGLSSDPAMNWRLSALDRYALISSSDAHSPEKLGREASLFDCELSYFGLRDALRGPRDGFLGTVEFFPEEGKYHFDGHRKCNVVLSPAEARAREGLCPACGKRLTGGVLARVEALADRPEGFRPPGAKGFRCLVPLGEVLGEVVGVGAGSERVRAAWERLLRKVGPELTVLMDAPVEDIAREAPPLLGEALRRMRAGEVKTQPGYDGEYGVVRVFDQRERAELLAQRSFGFAFAAQAADAPASSPPPPARAPLPPAPLPAAPAAQGLDPEQRAAVAHAGGPLLIVAGPGTGKTRTVVERIAALVRAGISPRAITAISFTRKAAAELGERLVALLGAEGRAVSALTFHAQGLALLRAFPEAAGLPAGFVVMDEAGRRALGQRIASELGDPPRSLDAALEAISRAKATRSAVPAELGPFAQAYERGLAMARAVDFDDLVGRAVKLLEHSPEALAFAQERCRHLFVDEYQDVNAAQVRLVQLLGGEELCVVGDPDQAIYGFRGADPGHFARFTAGHPDATTVTLVHNHRSPAAVVKAATAVMERSPGRAPRPLHPRQASSPPVERFVAATAAEEAELIAAEIERAVGGTSLTSFDTGRADTSLDAALAFHDIAVLFRTAAQAEAIEEALDRATIPFRRVGVDPLLSRPAVARLVTGLRARGGASPTPVGDLVKDVAGATIAEPAVARAVELLAALALPFGADREAFLASLALLRDIDLRLEPQRVLLSTLHAAKGLEFPLVIIAGCESGLLPLWLPGQETDLEEERRLLYVGMTRARQRLVLTSARRRTIFGRTLEGGPCPFLAALPPDLLVDVSSGPRRPRARQLPLGL